MDTVWTITSEGRKKCFYSEESLEAFVNTNRPADDTEFVVEKVSTETYTIKSRLPKLVVDKQLMLDLVHYLGTQMYINSEKLLKQINSSSCFKNIVKFGQTEDRKYNQYYTNAHIHNYPTISKFEYYGQYLMHATLDDISDCFRYNQCDYKSCHNYAIRYTNEAERKYQEEYEKIRPIGDTDYEEYKRLDDALDAKYKNIIRHSFIIQFRLDGPKSDNDIVLADHVCHGRNTRCVISKKLQFTSEELDKFKNFIDSLIN